ncbi:MAG: hypothetical protein PUB04_08385 [Clostridia bacterium]|nr:hypothetical protein [Clostridia bacterium]
MFCTKCGYNAGTAKFCPKCGSPLNPQPAHETPVQPAQETPVQPAQETPVQPVQETPVQPVQETPVQPAQETPVQPVQETPVQPVQETPVQSQFGTAQPQFGTAQPQFGTVPPYTGDIPRYQPASQMPPQPKKKKKWPIVVAVIAALAAIIAVLGVIFVPKLKDSLSPDKHAKAAIKNLGSNFEQTVNNSIDNMSAVSISDKNEISGSIKIDTATFNNQKYSDYVKADTLSYNIQADASTQKIAGDVKLQSGSSVLLTVSFYSDGTNVYFKVPEFFSESFTVSLAQLTDSTNISIDSSLSDLSMYMSMFDSSSIDLYKEPIKAAAQCIAKGIDTFAEECEYNKAGELTYQTDNGEIKVTEYGVTVTKAALTNAVNTVIDELYADKSMSSYMSLLTMAGVSQTSLKTEFAELVEDMKPVKFNMYVDKDEEIVRVSVNAKDYDASEEGIIAVSFIGKESKLNHVVFEAEADDTTMKYDIKSESNKCVVAFEMSQDKEYIKAGLECTNSGSNSVKIDNMYINCDIDDAKFDVKLSVDSTQKEFSSLKYSSSNFANPINVNKITEAQSYTLQMELVQNINVLSKILSDKVYNQLIYGTSIN